MYVQEVGFDDTCHDVESYAEAYELMRKLWKSEASLETLQAYYCLVDNGNCACAKMRKELPCK